MKAKLETIKTEPEKIFYINLFGSNMHHVIITSYVLWIYCNPACQNPYPFKWFRDEVCMLEFDVNFIYAGLITAAFLSFDYCLQRYKVKDKKSKVAKLSLLHHLIGISGIVIGFLPGYAAPGIGSIALISEISTINLNYRDMQ